MEEELQPMRLQWFMLIFISVLPLFGLMSSNRPHLRKQGTATQLIRILLS
jgi:hypothetical protein